MGISGKWNIDIEFISHSDFIDELIDAGSLSSRLREAIVPMKDEVAQAYADCYTIMLPIQAELRDIAKRRTFRGKCPACP
jgi:hypothetical protein